MNLTRGNYFCGAKLLALVAVSGVCGVAFAQKTGTLDCSTFDQWLTANHNGTEDWYSVAFSGSGGPFDAVYTDTTSGPVLTQTDNKWNSVYCTSVTHDMGLPSGPFDVHAEIDTNGIGFLLDNEQALFAFEGVTFTGGVGSAPIDNAAHSAWAAATALQLTIWTQTGTSNYTATSYLTDISHNSGATAALIEYDYSLDVATANSGNTAAATYYNYVNGGQPQVAPGPGGGSHFNVTPEPVTVALSIAGLALAVRRRVANR